MAVLYYNGKRVAMINGVAGENIDISDIKNFLITNYDMPEDTPVHEYIYYLEKSLWTYTLSGDTVTITKYTGNTGVVNIPPPSIFGGTNMTLSGNLFSGTYESFTVPEGVTRLNGNIFYYMNCPKIYLPKSLTYMSGSVFNRDLVDVYYAGDVVDWSKIDINTSSAHPMIYGDNMYFNGVKITELDIPSTVTSLKKYSFYNMTQITKLTIFNTLQTVNSTTFSNCVINTFEYLGTLNEYLSTQVDIGIALNDNSIITINGNEISGDIIIPDAQKSIRTRMFNNCNKITNITIHDTVNSISSKAFYNCTSLTRLDLPGIYTYMGANLFENTDIEVYLSNMYEALNNWTFNWSYGASVVVFKPIVYTAFSIEAPLTLETTQNESIYLELTLPMDTNGMGMPTSDVSILIESTDYVQLQFFGQYGEGSGWTYITDASALFDETGRANLKTIYSYTNPVKIKIEDWQSFENVSSITFTLVFNSDLVVPMPDWMPAGTEHKNTIDQNTLWSYETIEIPPSAQYAFDTTEQHIGFSINDMTGMGGLAIRIYDETGNIIQYINPGDYVSMNIGNWLYIHNQSMDTAYITLGGGA